jgi:tetratricopeptide (TPR) repeat protein
LALYRAGRFDDAVERLRETIHIEEQFADAHVMLGVALVQKAMHREAIGEFKRALELTGHSPEVVSLLGYGYGMAGRAGDARATLQELDQLSRQGRPVSAFARATVHIGLGELNSAFEWLNRAYEERLWYLGLLAVDPLFEPLRRDARFTDLLQRMHLTNAAASHREQVLGRATGRTASLPARQSK